MFKLLGDVENADPNSICECPACKVALILQIPASVGDKGKCPFCTFTLKLKGLNPPVLEVREYET